MKTQTPNGSENRIRMNHLFRKYIDSKINLNMLELTQAKEVIQLKQMSWGVKLAEKSEVPGFFVGGFRPYVQNARSPMVCQHLN